MLLEYRARAPRLEFKNSRPYHPQTCGKVERLHQTLKRYLAKQPPAQTLSELQGQLDAFAHYYNHIRPHRALDGRTPLQAYSARMKAKPAGASARTYFRVRQDKVDKTGKVSLRYDSRLYKIGLGSAHKGRAIKLLIADRDIRVIDLQGQLIRELTLDPSRNYQPLTDPKLSTMSRDTRPACPDNHNKPEGGGIRTPEAGVTRLLVFKTSAFNRSATLPERGTWKG